MIQHYVPQLLLRRFSGARDGQIWAFDKQTGRAFPTATKNIAAEKDFYDLELDEVILTLEPSLASLEAVVADAFSVIVQRESLDVLTDADRAHISMFAAAQMLRTKYHRDLWERLHGDLRDAIIRRGGNPKDIPGFIESEAQGALRAESLRFLHEKTPKFAALFAEKTWVLYKASADDPFYISDNPIAFKNTLNQNSYGGSLGLACPGIEIYLPLSPVLCLCFLCPTVIAYIREFEEKGRRIGLNVDALAAVAAINGKCATVLPENVMNLNSLQVLYSARFVFANAECFGLVQRMIAEHPEFKGGLFPSIV